MADNERKARFICDECGAQIRKKEDLTVHMRSIHGKDVTFTCDECSKGFNQRSNLTHHIRTRHKNIRAFGCQICETDFSEKAELQSHQRRHHQGIMFECDACGTLFGNKKFLPRHINSVHRKFLPFASGICGATFSRPGGVKSHTDVKHNSKQLQCDHCGKMCGYKGGLTVHILSVHLSLRRFKCDRCPAQFKCQPELKRHKQSLHEKIVFVCDICARAFTQKHELAGHCIAFHMGLSVFKCSECGGMFPNRHALLVHKKIHC